MKLTTEDVQKIRTMAGSSAEIAAEFGVSKSTVKGIRNGTRHSSVPGYVRPEMARHVRGSAVSLSKLFESDVISIRESSMSNSELGELYGVTRQLIWQIRQGTVWAWLASHASDPLPTCYGLEETCEEFAQYRKRVSSDEAAAMLMLVDALNDKPEEPLLDTEAVATALNVSVKLVQALAQSGKVRSIKVGKLIRFKREWLTDFVTPRKSRSRHF